MGRVTTDGFFSGKYEDDEEAHDLNLKARIESDTDKGTVEVEYESRGKKLRNNTKNIFDDLSFARKIAYLQGQMLATQQAERYRNRPIEPDWKPAKRIEVKKKQCPACNGVGRLDEWWCDDCGGEGWTSGN